MADLSMDSFVSIQAPPTVKAGVPFNATINVDWHGLADSSYAYAFRIYLGTSYRDKSFYMYYSECYLNYEQPLCDPSIIVSEDSINLNGTLTTVTIPPTVGPSGKHYAIIGRILNTDGSYYGAEWQSDVFDLTGANGTWGKMQRQGYQLWGDDGISCAGFACVKDCGDVIDPSTTNDTYSDCTNSCPGVDINPSSHRGGQPTAALTKPTACPEHAVASAASSVPTPNDLLGSSTRTANSVATGAASHSVQYPSVLTILWFVAAAITAR